MPPHLGGVVDSYSSDVLDFEAYKDDELREKIVAGHVPTIDTIKRFFSMISHCARYSPQCNVVALIYINRITSKNKIALTSKNWRGLWVASIILAQKVWDDTPLRTSSFADILPGVTKQQLRAMEFKAFVLLDYTTHVKPSTYARYHFELRVLFQSIFPTNPNEPFPLKPLTVVEGVKLEDKSARAAKYFRLPTSSSSLDSRRSSDSPLTVSSKASLPASINSPCRTTEKLPKTLEDATYTPQSARLVLRL